MAEPLNNYVELHCHSMYSLLDGAARPKELIARARALGMDALALTDHDNLYGAISFVDAARAAGVRPILGAELTLDDDSHLTLLVEDQRGWQNLCTLISRAQQHAPKGAARLPRDELQSHSEGLLALSGCRRGPIAAPLLRGQRAEAITAAQDLIRWFGPRRCFIEIQHHLQPDDDALVADLAALAAHVGLPAVLTNNVHYATRAGQPVQDVLTCIRHRVTLDEAGARLRPNSEYFLKPGAMLAPLVPDHLDALRQTRLIAERCRFDLSYGLQDLPAFPTPPGFDAPAFLRDLCLRAARKRYESLPDAVVAQLDHELAVMVRAGLANYLLIVWDIVRFARDHGIRCQGRGSAANSLVAYLLGISPIDPLAHDLLFERFLSDERPSLPDIDLDIAADRREEVIQYVYRRYGAAHAAMACTLVTFRARSATREIGMALNVPPSVVQAATEQIERADTHDAPAAATHESAAEQPQDAAPAATMIATLAQALAGLPRHLGIHNGGMVLTGSPITTRLPTEPAAMPDRVVVQWDKDALETAGLVKIDLLGLRMLSVLSESEAYIRARVDPAFTLDALTFDDPEVYALIARGDTVGIFQVESRAQAQLQPRLQPRCFNDLSIAISLIRPGPLQGEMVHPYLRRRDGLEPVTYAHPSLQPALAETLGVILFQEQVLKVARDVAGFTPGQGEQLRRALGSKHAATALAALRDQFLAGAATQGVPIDVAAAIFQQLSAFAGYSFPKSHAAAFAVLVYQSAYLKRYHPAAFFAALLNHQPMGFWAPAQLVADAKRHGVAVLPVEIERSQEKCRVRGNAIRLGLCFVTGFGAESCARLIATRRERPFADLADLCRRTRLPRRLVERLIKVGALDRWGRSRRSLLWELGTLHYAEDALDVNVPVETPDLPPLSRAEQLLWEERIQGFALHDHPLAVWRPILTARGLIDSRSLHAIADGSAITIAGRIVIHQAPPTARGHHFLTLEDEHDLINVVVRPAVVTRYAGILRSEPLIEVSGHVQQQRGVVTLVATHIAPLQVESQPGTRSDGHLQL